MRRTQRAKREVGTISTLPFSHVRNPYRPVEVLSADQVEHIHTSALRLLATTGMRILDDGARSRH